MSASVDIAKVVSKGRKTWKDGSVDSIDDQMLSGCEVLERVIIRDVKPIE